jgi:HD-GYP domain-containing protein (c-di-GMP phosphodiesterase class II)
MSAVSSSGDRAGLQQPGRATLAELLGVLSLATDLGMGQPMEHMLRQCLISLRLADRLGLSSADCEAVYYTSLLAWVGCNVDAFEQAKWFGDELAFKRDARLIDWTGPRPALKYLRDHLGAGKPGLERARLAIGFLAGGYRDLEVMLVNHWRAVEDLMIRLGLEEPIRQCVAQSFARWGGNGVPPGLHGEDILVPSRIVNLADVADMFHGMAGVGAAISVATDRAGTDVKSPYTIGHSRGVAELAAQAARTCALSPAEITEVRRAALLHDLGRLGVSNTIWDKQSPLNHAELERVRLHPYLTERMLASSATLAPLARIAVQHHERLEGSGYPRGLSGDALTTAGRVLAAADMYHARIEPRPHRSARTPAEAAADLRNEVRAGRLDADAVDAVLNAAGHRVAARREWPAGLTTREVEVLRLLARGLSCKQIAQHLVISPKTASNHIEHVYAKLGVTNRALASLFAAKHGLIGD